MGEVGTVAYECARADRAEAEIDRLRRALELYAARETYAPGVREYWGGETEPCAPPIFGDMGKAARDALNHKEG